MSDLRYSRSCDVESCTAELSDVIMLIMHRRDKAICYLCRVRGTNY